MPRKTRGRSKGRSSKRRRSTRSAPKSPPSPHKEEGVLPTPDKVIAKAPARQAAAVDFKAEYHYVYSDLKRIGILAAVAIPKFAESRHLHRAASAAQRIKADLK